MKLAARNILVVCILVLSFENTEGQDCLPSDGGNRVVDAYIGWPFRLSCGNAFVEEFYTYYEDYDISCTIRDMRTGEIVVDVFVEAYTEDYEIGFNRVYYTPDISLNGTLVYEFNFLAGVDECRNATLTINPIQLPESSCEQSVENFFVEEYDVRNPTAERNFIIDCQIYDADPRPRLYFQDDRTDYSVSWFQNCNKISNPELQGPSIRFTPFTFQDPGNYTCAFTYNGMTRYFSTNLCAYPTTILSLPVVRCTPIKQANLGKSVILECFANIGIANFQISNFKITWEQISSTGSREESNFLNCTTGFEENSNNNRTSCNVEIVTGQSLDCYDFPITEDLVANFSTSASLKFEISNVNEDDFGRYQLTMERRFTFLDPVREEITLEENIIPELENLALIVGLCVAAVVVFLILVALIWWKIFYIKLYFKRHFAAFKPDDKEFGAVLSYHFSKGEVDKFAQDQTKKAVLGINKTLEDLGYKTFDENRDDRALAYKAEGIIGLMHRSHRVIIVMTSNYIKDHWSMFTLRKALFQMIEAKLKIAFIMMPGIKEYIKQHKEEDETCKLLHKAIKINKEIKWSDKEKFDEKFFKNQLEYFMPKLDTMKNINRDVVE